MKHVVITGATGGIGFELCRRYLDQGANVTAVCRNRVPELVDLGVDILDQIDLTNDSAYEKMEQHFQGRSIDILINNAGLLQRDSLEDFTVDSLRKQFEVNAIAPLRVTHALLPSLSKLSKIAMITSRMGSIEDNTSGGYYGYRASKAALNMIAVSLALDLKEKSIWVGLIHPGFVKTKMTKMAGNITSAESAGGIFNIIDAAKLEESGSFWHMNGERLPW